MKFTIIDNFLTEDLCKNLISDAEKLIKDNDFSKIHGNRKSLVNSNLNFRKLTDNSKSWKELESIINSQSFLELCCEKLSIKKKLVLKEFFKPNNHSKLFKKYKAISGSSVNKISTFALCKYLIMRLFRDLLRNLRFSKFFFPFKIPIELLFDYSKAGNGYEREIHRDSDGRIIVFLLYLNSFPKNNTEQTGGTLDLYKLSKETKNLSQPDKNSCELIKSVKPELGKMLIFLNKNDSYHAVSKIKNLNGSRYFIYGGYTALSQKNPFITNNSKLKTDFHFYD
jgi:hypothetical protein